MLHEILLSLSGHPSPLFASANEGGEVRASSIALLSSPEAELLSSIGQLAQLHRQIRSHATHIAATHGSAVCRAVATTILSGALARFQKKILEVESRILTHDASIVGGYNIVPLAGVVSEFDEWTRLMGWLWDVASYIEVPQEKDTAIKSSVVSPELCSGANVINKLRLEAQTGYPDIEEAALVLGKAAEIAWLRQLSSWVLYGRLPAGGAEDFFVKLEDKINDLPIFASHSEYLPKFVSEQTASSIIFIGRSLNHIRIRGKAMEDSESTAPKMTELELVPVHLKYLSGLSVPISSVALTEAIGAIRASLSAKMLQRLLPISKILELLSILQEFFLLGRGEFAIALIAEADERLNARHKRDSQPAKGGLGLHGVLIKDGEVSSTLSRALSSVATSFGDSDDAVADDIFDLARSLLRMHTINPGSSSSARPSTPGRASDDQPPLVTLSPTSFADNLFAGVPVALTMTIPAPLDLFLSPSDLDIYSAIQSYLLALRRAHIHIAALWRNSALRRCHPTPGLATSPFAAQVARRRREREQRRAVEMRKVWATCGAALFLLAEMEAYFEGEIVAGAWAHLRRWMLGGSSTNTSSPQSSSRSGKPPSTTHTNTSNSGGNAAAGSPPTASLANLNLSHSIRQHHPDRDPPSPPPHDPESLARAHRAHLRTLASALLLTDSAVARALKELLAHADALAALAARLQALQSRLDLEEDAGIEEDEAARGRVEAEEAEVRRELDRARKRVDAALRAVVGRLRAIGESGGAGGDLVGAGVAGGGDEVEVEEEGGFRPWRPPGVDRLLMKLDFGRASREEGERGESEGV